MHGCKPCVRPRKMFSMARHIANRSAQQFSLRAPRSIQIVLSTSRYAYGSTETSNKRYEKRYEATVSVLRLGDTGQSEPQELTTRPCSVAVPTCDTPSEHAPAPEGGGQIDFPIAELFD